MKYTQTKTVIELANDLDIDRDELVNNIENLERDFEVDDYRFIREDVALDIAIDTYKGDPYILGFFNDWFIADNCNINLRVVKALQKARAYEELGELMLDNGIDELIEEYISSDGYGHVFGSYDHSFDEVTLNDEDYIYFRT